MDQWRRMGRGSNEGEFPPGADDAPDEVSRRSFLQLLGASLALAGAGACGRASREKALPYNEQPVGLTPGVPLRFATSMVLDGLATGLLVQSREGRPIKVEGNPEHPASLGATGAFEQASVLDLYAPDRARGVFERAEPRLWEDAARALAGWGGRDDQGAGLRLLLEPTGSPLLGAMLEELHARLPRARVTFFAPSMSGGAAEAVERAWGRSLALQHDLSAADVVLALDADFLDGGPGRLRLARQFADCRRVTGPDARMNRLYCVEARPSPTGSLADHRLQRRSSEVASAGAAVLVELVQLGARHPLATEDVLARAAGAVRVEDHAWAGIVARDLLSARGGSVVLAGPRQPVAVHLVALLCNALLEALGRTVWTTEPVLLDGGEAGLDLTDLARELHAGEVDTLVIAEGDPCHTAPRELALAQAVGRIEHSLHLSARRNRTSRQCAWTVGAAHYLEAWGDARAFDGTVSFIQPLIDPLYGGKTSAQVLSALLGTPEAGSLSLLQEHWRGRSGATPFEPFWESALRRGLIPDSGAVRVDAPMDPAGIARGLEALGGSGASQGLEVGFYLDASVHDGRFVDNAWLQEMPDPITKLTWDNAALLSPRTAQRLGVADEDMLVLSLGRERLQAPALIVPGHVDDAVSLDLGYGQADASLVGRDVGFDAYVLRSAARPWFSGGLEVRRGAGRRRLAATQLHWRMEGRPLALSASIERLREEPELTREQRGPVLSLMPELRRHGPQWGMMIDLGLCTGCSACVVACQAENNVPVVGKSEVLRSREMHWLRIDRYVAGPSEDPRFLNQPMLCQHCEKAPCEYVCPVNATVHSPDGLNEMVYNRCVGTRFCSNNCPYKVRRFNWFDYVDRGSQSLQKNPEVTVRERGVMEKCTYCVQRIRAAGIQAAIGAESEPVVTACAQACPTRAIVFGDLADPRSEVSRAHRRAHRYEVLHDLGTRPRTQYLLKIDNPNPALSRTD